MGGRSRSRDQSSVWDRRAELRLRHEGGRSTHHSGIALASTTGKPWGTEARLCQLLCRATKSRAPAPRSLVSTFLPELLFLAFGSAPAPQPGTARCSAVQCSKACKVDSGAVQCRTVANWRSRSAQE
ncbi:unnamed protein product [Polarella glacialis]|uniref:Uncharacterized protein n=1 Tax=Polarella glacialis TaxID=89957 RepID=A0A813IRH9_POLGL|nr:unnamed protein product [Polarella glacialis]